MTSQEFCYWLQGFFELTTESPTPKDLGALSAMQAALIKRHLDMVFKHEIDPSYENQEELNEIHNPGTSHLTGSGSPTLIRC